MADIADMISRLGYKPGWSFGFEEGVFSGMLVIKMAVLDSRDPDRTLFFTVKRVIPDDCGNLGAFKLFIKRAIAEAEYHEMREFLRYDGELIDDPHQAETV